MAGAGGAAPSTATTLRSSNINSNAKTAQANARRVAGELGRPQRIYCAYINRIVKNDMTDTYIAPYKYCMVGLEMGEEYSDEHSKKMRLDGLTHRPNTHSPRV